MITSSPSEDHTYSAGNENDEPNAADKVNGVVVVEQSDLDFEEQRKKAEGVDALLNLAGFASNTTSQILMKRRASSSDMLMGGFSNENSMDCSNNGLILCSPSPTKRSKTQYLQPAV